MKYTWDSINKPIYLWSIDVQPTGQRQPSRYRIGFLTTSGGPPGYPQEKNESGPLTHNIHKINSKWIMYLNVRTKILKLLQETIGVNLHGLGSDNGFFKITPKAQTTTEKNR